jgi:large subunit ribosomal protein L21
MEDSQINADKYFGKSEFSACGYGRVAPVWTIPTETEFFMAYAVIQTGGKQYRVAEGDEIEVEKLDVEAGKKAEFAEVLLVANGSSVTIGEPLVAGAKVTAEVVDQFKDDKVIAFKFKRRKGYHRTVGHRRQLTKLKIESISTK